MNIILMSGISGAGKDTYIRGRFKNPIICSADAFFETDEGYSFNPSQLPAAHGACLRKFIEASQLAWDLNSDEHLIVNNTNLSSEELAPYVAIASAYMHPIELVTVHCQPHIAAARSLHVNAIQVLRNMHDRLMARKLPPFWNMLRTEVNA